MAKDERDDQIVDTQLYDVAIMAAIKEKFMEIPADEVRSPNTIPLRVYQQEARQFYMHAMNDFVALSMRKLTKSDLECLLHRADAVEIHDSDWKTERFTTSEALKEWNEKSPQAYEIRNELVDEIEWALGNDPDIKKIMADIKEGTGHVDMIEDLFRMLTLVNKHLDSLKATGFDESLAVRGKTIVTGLNNLLAEANVSRDDYKKIMDVRDRAYTYLKQAVDKVLHVARFVFRDNEGKMNNYRSPYLHRRNLKAARKNKKK